MDTEPRREQVTGDYERLADRLDAASSAGVVGREEELARLSGWIDADGPPSVVFVHGAPGIGTTTLVRQLARARGSDTLLLDGDAVEPTPAGVLSSLAALVGTPPDLDQIGAALAAGHRCLVIDGAERLLLVDSWLRNVLLPAMPASLTTVLAGRQRPNVAWLTAPGWQGLVADLPLGPLTTAEARSLLSRLAVSDGDVDALLRFSRGHPLALRLAASAPGGASGDTWPAPVAVEHLVDRVLDGLSPADVRLVQAASVLRRVVAGDLAVLLDGEGPEGGPDEWWRRLRDLPFAEVRTDGLELHDVVRDAVQLSMARRDPDRHARLRARAVRAVRERVSRSAPDWSTTADLLHLVRDPVLRDGFFPPTGDALAVDDATPEDRPSIDALVARHEGEESAGHVRAWLDAHPGSVRVARDHAGSTVAFQSAVELRAADGRLLRADPVAAEWMRHLDRDPMPPDALALLIRASLGEEGGTPTPATSSLFVDVKRTYMELRPRLRRVYLVTRSLEPTLPEQLGFRELARRAIDGMVHRALVLDFGAGSVDGWLAGLLAAETDAGPDAAGVDEAGAPSPLDSLTPRERDVLALVAAGATNKDVAARLGISLKTVGRHMENLFVKLEVTSRAAAARLATRHGLVD